MPTQTPKTMYRVVLCNLVECTSAAGTITDKVSELTKVLYSNKYCCIKIKVYYKRGSSDF